MGGAEGGEERGGGCAVALNEGGRMRWGWHDGELLWSDRKEERMYG